MSPRPLVAPRATPTAPVARAVLPPAAAGTGSSTATSEGAAPPLDDSRLNEPLRAERRKSNQLEKEIRTLRQQLNRFSEITPPLRGLEGSAAALYYRSLAACWSPMASDSLRSRRPPLTPFDALCGFGYGVLRNSLLHVGSARNAALLSDLIEPLLRSFLVDPFHGQLIRAGQLSASEHFLPHGGGVYLNDGGRRVWLRAWSTFMAETIQLGDTGSGPLSEVLDQLVKSFAAVVDDPDRQLSVPLRR